MEGALISDDFGIILDGYDSIIKNDEEDITKGDPNDIPRPTIFS